MNVTVTVPSTGALQLREETRPVTRTTCAGSLHKEALSCRCQYDPCTGQISGQTVTLTLSWIISNQFRSFAESAYLICHVNVNCYFYMALHSVSVIARSVWLYLPYTNYTFYNWQNRRC